MTGHHPPLVLYVAVLLLSHLFAAATVGAGGYVVTMKDGSFIRTPTYSEKDGKVCYQQFGSEITVPREAVLGVRHEEQRDLYGKRPAQGNTGHLDVPVYLSVSGVKNKDFNGIYEESGVHNSRPLFKQVNGRFMLFYANNHSRIPVWSLGELGIQYSRISLVNSYVGDKGYPENQGGWTSSTGEIMYPLVKVAKVKPPDTVFSGYHAYTVQDFPLPECNGTYRPKSISTGHVSYVHEENPYKLHYYANSWAISFCPKNCFIQFSSDNISSDTPPENIDDWYNLGKKRVTGNVSIFHHQTYK